MKEEDLLSPLEMEYREEKFALQKGQKIGRYCGEMKLGMRNSLNFVDFRKRLKS